MQEYIAHKKTPPEVHTRSLGTGLLEVPRRRRFFMSDIPHVQYGFVQGSTVALGGVDVSYERGNLAQCRGQYNMILDATFRTWLATGLLNTYWDLSWD